MRVGLGFDLHKIRPTRNGFLLLGGVPIPAPFEVLAHSDGDILLHALSDAIFSALGLPDIGVLFPPGQKSTKGMDSKKILNRALAELKNRKKKLINVSCVVVLEKPRLTNFRESIRGSLAQLLGIKKDGIGLSAKSFEGLFPLANKAIACWVNCLIQ